MKQWVGVFVVAVLAAWPITARGQHTDYPQMLRACGPAGPTSRLGGLWMLDEPPGADAAADTMRTAAMAAAGWGAAATGHDGAASGVVFGVMPAGLIGQSAALFNGAGAGIAIAEGVPLGPMLEFNARFTITAVCRFDIDETLGPAEHAIFSRSLAGGTGRGFEFSARFDGAAANLHARHVNTIGGQRNIASGSTPLPSHVAGARPDAWWFVAVVHDGSGGYTFYARDLALGGELAPDTTAMETATLASTAQASTAHIGCRDGAGAWFKGEIQGVSVQPRNLPHAAVQQLYDAARGVSPNLPRHANMAVIRDALAANCFARAIGDSTSVPGDPSVSEHIPRRLQTANLIPRRAAQMLPASSVSRAGGGAYLEGGITSVLGAAAAAPFDAAAGPLGVPPATVFRFTGADPAEDAVCATFNNTLTDVHDAATFPHASARFIFARSAHPTAAPGVKFGLSNDGGATYAASGTVQPSGVDARFATADVSIAGESTATVRATINGSALNEADTYLAVYGAWIINAADPIAAESGLWWAGSLAKDGVRTEDHAADALYTMEGVDEFDAALTAGLGIDFDARVVFVLLTINDLNANANAASVRANMESIAARWTSRGYKVCFIQPWLPYLSLATDNPSRLPHERADEYWTDAFLPIATGDVAVVSLHQYYRTCPWQYIESFTLPSYAVHAANAAGALALTAPLGEALGEPENEAGGPFEIAWYTMDAGGGALSGGSYTLSGTIGQSVDVGQARTGINTSVSGGYWEQGVVAPACAADFNESGAVTVQDIYDFLFAWNAMDMSADFNGNGFVTVQDIYDFLFAWSNGCP